MSGATERNHALDFTKGALVVLMIIYHWMNYFVEIDARAYNYLRFITPSFIFIAGFLVGNLYSTRQGNVHSRLAVRGLKLLAFFTLINLVAGSLFLAGYKSSEGDSESLFVRAFSVYVSGNGKYAGFQVLVPIAYLLLLASVLLAAGKGYVPLTIGFYLACVVSVAVMAQYGIWSFNLELVSFGLLGILVGGIPLNRINRLAEYALAIAVAYAVYLWVVTVLGVPYWVQVIGVSLSLVAIYCVGLALQDRGVLVKHVILLGKYTLFGYVAQIGILRVLRRMFAEFNVDNSILALIMACALTSAVILAVDRARANWSLADRSYRLVFS